MGNWYFRQHVMPEVFDYSAHKKDLSPFFKKYGFQVSMMYNDFYSHFNGTGGMVEIQREYEFSRQGVL